MSSRTRPIGSATASRSAPLQAEALAEAKREASIYFRKFDKYDLIESSCRRSTHHLLSCADSSTLLVDAKTGTVPPPDGASILLIPHDPQSSATIHLTELRQIIRELVIGVYVFNETPLLRFERHHDTNAAAGAVNCILPPAYVDTRVGQTLISVLAAANFVSYGVAFADERRRRFAENWRDLLAPGAGEANVEILRNAGLIDLADEDDGDGDGDGTAWTAMNEPFRIREDVDGTCDLNSSEIDIVVEATEIVRCGNIFNIDSQWTATTRSHATEKIVDVECYLQAQRDFLRRHFAAAPAPDIRHLLSLLRFIATATQYFVSLKSQCRIPIVDLSRTYCAPESLKTERELPPFCAVRRPRASPFACLDRRQLVPLRGSVVFFPRVLAASRPSRNFVAAADYLVKTALECDDAESFGTSLTPLGDEQFYLLHVPLENYYATSPKVPRWIHAVYSEFAVQTAAASVGSAGENRIQDALRRRLGSKQLAKMKSANVALVVSAQRGIVSVFQTSAKRSTHTRLSKPYDETGVALVHQAAQCDQPAIIHWLAQHGCDLNVRCHDSAGGATALHVASKCGSLESVCCLVATGADVGAYDARGWLPIHHAAYRNHVHVLDRLVAAQATLVDATTNDDVVSTPLLLAASSGALDAVKRLVYLRADTTIRDRRDKSVVHAATMELHVNVLLYIINLETSTSLSVWSLFVDMLKSPIDSGEPERAARCLNPISKAHGSYVSNIVKAGTISALYNLLTTCDDVRIQSRVALVLQNISGDKSARETIISLGVVGKLVSMLASPSRDVQAHVANVVADVSCVEGSGVAEKGAVERLIPLLSSDDVRVRINAVGALRVVVVGVDAQNAVLKHDGVRPLVALLSSDLERLQMLAAGTVRVVAARNASNQEAFVRDEALPVLIRLLRSRNLRVQIEAAGAIEAVTDGNVASQQAVVALRGVLPLKRMLKFKNAYMKVGGACALWAVAGDAIGSQRDIAAHIGIDMLTQLLALGNDRLNVISAQALYALASGPSAHRNEIAKKDGVAALVRLLQPREKSSVEILLAVMRALAALCVGPAHTPHVANQNMVAEKRGLEMLSHLLSHHPDPLINAKAGWVLSCACLCNGPVQKTVVLLTDFNFARLVTLLESDQLEVSLHAGMALSTFAYNSPLHQQAITSIGGVDYYIFRPFLSSTRDDQRAHAAFQTIVLAKVLKGSSDISITVEGLEILVDLLKSSDDSSKILSAELIASLAHTRPGIPDAIVVAGAVPLLLANLSCDVSAVSASAAIALGYLTFNGTAARRLIKAFRDEPRLYDRFRRFTHDGRVSDDFVERWRVAKQIGLPSLSLQSKGGPPIIRDFRPISGRLSAPLPRQHDVEAMNPFRVRMVTSAFPASKSSRGKRRRQRAISVPISAPAGMDLTKTRSTATASAVSAVSRSSSSTILKQTSFARGEIA